MHFRKTLAGGYRYLDKCGEFLLDVEKVVVCPGALPRANRPQDQRFRSHKV